MDSVSKRASVTSQRESRMHEFEQPVAPPGGPEASDILATLWRYRWAVLLPGIAGAMIGFVLFSRTPETYKSATRLMVESDRPAILDSITGDLVGGVPGIDIVRSQLLSDRVISMAYEDIRMQPFHAIFGESPNAFAGTARGCLSLNVEVADTRGGQAQVVVLSFQHTNAELCDASVAAFSNALQQFFNERQKSSRSELIKLITVATEQLDPKIALLEQQYRDFRRDAPLAWNSSGEAINPHRERQLFLIQKRSELFEKLRDKSILLASVDSIEKKTNDPIVALGIVGQLLGVGITIPDDNIVQRNLREGDTKLAEIELDQQLVPLMIERNKFAAEFGDSHPTVKQLDTELSMMKSELKRLVGEQAARIVELAEKGRDGGQKSSERAKEALMSILTAARAEESLLQEQMEDLDKQIAEEKRQAIELARFEQDNVAMLREIERTRGLMNQLEEQMARVSLTEEEGGTRVVELTSPGKAYLVGPNLNKSLGMGTFLGLALGAGLALLLEKNANTFRDPDEIAKWLGIPVLTHLPYYRGRPKRSKKDKHLPDPYKDLDNHMAAVHSPSSVAAEAIRTCRTSIFFELAGPGGKILQVTSPLPGDGKTTIAGNLACSIAQSGKRVLAIDCDLRRPQLTDNFAMVGKLGLTDVLNGDCDPVDACQQTPIATLHVMPSGPVPSNPAEALTLPEMSELLELMRDQYDFIVVDTPPLLVVTDASITASMVDGVVLAMRIRRKSKPNSKEALSILNAVGANVVGLVINNSDEASASDGYKGYGYYRYGRYTSRYTRRQGANGEGSGESGDSRKSFVQVTGRGPGGFRKLPTSPERNGDVIESEEVRS